MQNEVNNARPNGNPDFRKIDNDRPGEKPNERPKEGPNKMPNERSMKKNSQRQKKQGKAISRTNAMSN